MKRKSLGFKLVAGGMLAVAIPLIVVGFFSVIRASNALNDLAREGVANLAKSLADTVNVTLSEELKLASDLAVGNSTMRALKKVDEFGVEGAAKELASLDRKFINAMKRIGKDYEDIVATDRNGLVISDGSGGGFKGISLADRAYFQAAVKGEDIVGIPVKSKKSGNPVIPVCVPIYTDASQQKIAGTLVLVSKIEIVVPYILGMKIGKTGYAYMTDKTGLIIVHQNNALVMAKNIHGLKGMEEISSAMSAQQAGVMEYVFTGIDKIGGYAPVGVAEWSVSVTQEKDDFLASAHAIQNMCLIVGVVFLVLTVLAILYFSRGIINPINRVIGGLSEGADQLASASAQVSSASQSLAEGASEQAASIEEVSSSLEEMASMTRQNTDNANQSDILMKETNEVVSKANNAMTQLTSSMDDISKASEETSKIIKTIDQIAFQTNLLALNAAVEAARAGEAGAGFAVVAEEVRNLALRSADAAKNTATLIEGTVKKVKDGSELVNTTNDAFSEVAANVFKSGELVAEIAVASTEHAEGIEQVNRAVTEMDKVVQQNAANAEESASASEEMTGQAQQMNGFVQELVDLVGGNVDGAQTGGSGIKSDRKPALSRKRIAMPASGNRTNRRQKSSSPDIRPEQVIPFDDDFKDF